MRAHTPLCANEGGRGVGGWGEVEGAKSTAKFLFELVEGEEMKHVEHVEQLGLGGLGGGVGGGAASALCAPNGGRRRRRFWGAQGVFGPFTTGRMAGWGELQTQSQTQRGAAGGGCEEQTAQLPTV